MSFNFSKMMKQVQQMQSDMQKMRETMENTSFEGAAGGDMVKATLNGSGKITALKINPNAVDLNDIEMLEDLIIAAINDAKKKVDSENEKLYSNAMGGMPLPPGFKMPF